MAVADARESPRQPPAHLDRPQRKTLAISFYTCVAVGIFLIVFVGLCAPSI